MFSFLLNCFIIMVFEEAVKHYLTTSGFKKKHFQVAFKVCEFPTLTFNLNSGLTKQRKG